MRLLLSLFLSVLCLFLSPVPLLQAGTIPSSTGDTTTGTASSSTEALPETVPSAKNDTEISFPPPTTTVSTQKDVKTDRFAETTALTTQSKTQAGPKLSNQSNRHLVVTVVLLLIALVFLLLFIYRWYKRNPDRRSFRGLLDSIVEGVQLARTRVLGYLQRPQKQEEELEDDEEVAEMEEGVRGETTDRGTEGGEEKQEEEDSESDDSSEESSPMDSANLSECEKQAEENEDDRRSSKEEREDMEEMTSVTLDEEDKVELKEVDDLTPL